ncbi:hypothetical protein [Archangium primigenium]|uniref:hypothetical protein n=1 Tax=[Archangium] primigenium TaxID=2792470 RepID=UPI00195C42EA|nr:hypothetical protein [Archangium primigenium]MBM7116122.1 hypothetical protein [Archangium primigenium]
MGIERNPNGRDARSTQSPGDARSAERPDNRKSIDFLRNRGESEVKRDLVLSEEEERSLEDTPVDQSRSGH